MNKNIPKTYKMLQDLDFRFYLNLDERYDIALFCEEFDMFKKYYYISFSPDVDLGDFATLMKHFCNHSNHKEELYVTYRKLKNIVNLHPFEKLGTKFLRTISRSAKDCFSLDVIESYRVR